MRLINRDLRFSEVRSYDFGDQFTSHLRYITILFSLNQKNATGSESALNSNFLWYDTCWTSCGLASSHIRLINIEIHPKCASSLKEECFGKNYLFQTLQKPVSERTAFLLSLTLNSYISWIFCGYMTMSQRKIRQSLLKPKFLCTAMNWLPRVLVQTFMENEDVIGRRSFNV